MSGRRAPVATWKIGGTYNTRLLSFRAATPSRKFYEVRSVFLSLYTGESHGQATPRKRYLTVHPLGSIVAGRQASGPGPKIWNLSMGMTQRPKQEPMPTRRQSFPLLECLTFSSTYIAGTSTWCSNLGFLNMVSCGHQRRVIVGSRHGYLIVPTVG